MRIIAFTRNILRYMKVLLIVKSFMSLKGVKGVLCRETSAWQAARSAQTRAAASSKDVR